MSVNRSPEIEKDLQLTFTGAKINCDGPNEYLYNFDGQLTLKDGKTKFPLGPDNFLLKGCSLQNTPFIYGVAVYTGHETKLMKNGSISSTKRSDIEKKTDMFVLAIMLS
jgi:magnesium-transporting ATPase (P-type)